MKGTCIIPTGTVALQNRKPQIHQIQDDAMWLQLVRESSAEKVNYMRKEGNLLQKIKVKSSFKFGPIVMSESEFLNFTTKSVNEKYPIVNEINEFKVSRWILDAYKPRPRPKLPWKKQKSLWKVFSENEGRPAYLECERNIFPLLPPIRPCYNENFVEQWKDNDTSQRPPITHTDSSGEIAHYINYTHLSANETKKQEPKSQSIVNIKLSRGPWQKSSDPRIFKRLSQPKPIFEPILPDEMLIKTPTYSVPQELFERLHTQRPRRIPVLPDAMTERPQPNPATKGFFDRLSVPKIREEAGIEEGEAKVAKKLDEKLVARLSFPKKPNDPFVLLPTMAEDRKKTSLVTIERLSQPKYNFEKKSEIFQTSFKPQQKTKGKK
ncbi:hypothetical protein HK096_009118 [Nowakowskiella sp. JEL0078]|nr:hypothetical protein HK096_009118 [Nowakowskiella sp. JEL0078]